MDSDTTNNKNVLGDALEQIMAQNERVLAESKALKAKRNIPGQDLEIALTVLLVDLATCDENFDQNEYQVISKGLSQMFGTSKKEVQALVNQAKLTISNLRGVNHFASLLKESLSEEDKKIVLSLIDEMIDADHQEDGFETYLRAKFVDLIGLKEEFH